MESHTSGTLVGTGTFRCVVCDYVVSLAAADTLPACPSCGGDAFVRASLFTAADVRAELSDDGQFLVYEESGEPVVHRLAREWTRVGRSLAADIRFDDPTVS